MKAEVRALSQKTAETVQAGTERLGRLREQAAHAASEGARAKEQSRELATTAEEARDAVESITATVAPLNELVDEVVDAVAAQQRMQQRSSQCAGTLRGVLERLESELSGLTRVVGFFEPEHNSQLVRPAPSQVVVPEWFTGEDLTPERAAS